MAGPLYKNDTGPGNPTSALLPEYITVKAGANITKGLLVAFTGTDGYTVGLANITTLKAIGVAAETASSGDWFKVQIAGICDDVTNDGTDVVKYDYLVADANAKVVPLTTAELDPENGTDGYEFHCIGQALQADTGTSCGAVLLYRQI